MTHEEFKKKPGYAPYKKDNKWQKDLVAIRVPDFPNDGEPAVVNVGIDTVHYEIPRGEDVKVPRLVKENLETRIQRQWAMPSRRPMNGLEFIGFHSRFHVFELSGSRAEAAKEIRPSAPMSASSRAAALKPQAVEDALALEASRND